METGGGEARLLVGSAADGCATPAQWSFAATSALELVAMAGGRSLFCTGLQPAPTRLDLRLADVDTGDVLGTGLVGQVLDTGAVAEVFTTVVGTPGFALLVGTDRPMLVQL